jgi:hypothetical protein
MSGGGYWKAQLSEREVTDTGDISLGYWSEETVKNRVQSNGKLIRFSTFSVAVYKSLVGVLKAAINGTYRGAVSEGQKFSKFRAETYKFLPLFHKNRFQRFDTADIGLIAGYISLVYEVFPGIAKTHKNFPEGLALPSCNSQSFLARFLPISETYKRS